MREHPIPQDIVGYRFHIIGSMTLKQFAELALGVIAALIIYSTNLIAPIKWSLIFFSVGIGAAAAFLPIAERPLDHWITTFIRVLYRPTKFFWKKSLKTPEIFLFKAGQAALDTFHEIDLTPARRQRIKDYLASVKNSGDSLDQEEAALQDRLDKIMSTFAEIEVKKTKPTKQRPLKPNLKIKTRSLTPSLTKKKVVFDQKTTTTPKKTALLATQVAKAIDVPKIKTTGVEAAQSATANQATPAQQEAVFVKNTDEKKSSSDNNSDQDNTQATVFNAALPFPSKPTQPNKLVGMVLTSHNELIPEAIIEIKDENNRVVRAVKSNALGQFFISTPLKSGHYSIFVKHEKYHFYPQEITLSGEIMEPIEIRSLS